MSFNRKRRLKNQNPVTACSLSGTLVKVLTGRTRGKTMALVSTFTDKSGKCLAYIADGVKYTVSKPKLKAASHLEALDSMVSVTDDEIRKSVCNH